MNYPLISEYIESIKSAEDNFEELSYLRPVLDDTGQPVMSSGNFAVVFKMKDERDGKLYAVRCFHRDQEGREESYRLIEEELKDVESPYLVSFHYIDRELFVDSGQTDETEFPVLLMDWVEGITLDKYLRENLDDQYALEMLAYRFSQLAQWLIPQPFAHGDLKPDNILVREDGTLVLVDYDGMYVPAMKGQKAHELGSPDFRHPLRTEDDFDEHIDDFPFVSILLSLKAISLNPQLLEEYGATDRLLLSEKDYRDVCKCQLLKELFPTDDMVLNQLVGVLMISIIEKDISMLPLKLIRVDKPKKLIMPSLSFTFSDSEVYSTEVKSDDLEKAWVDEFGVMYSFDGKKCLKATDPKLNCIIRDGVKVICDKAFSDCSVLASVNIPNSVTSIGKGAFMRCSGLTSVYISDSITSIGESAFWRCSGLTSVNIPDSVTSIGKGAFRNCRGLTSVNIPNSVTSIGESAFEGCGSLTSLVIEKGNCTYDSRGDCNAIIETATNTLIAGCVNTVIPNSVTSIGNSAFAYCSGLTSVNIPDSVTSIGKGAFRNCRGLTSVNIPNSVTSIGESAFEGCGSLTSLVIEKGNCTYDSRGDCNAIIETATNTLIAGCVNTVIPNSVTSIGNSAFAYCSGLTSVNIPNSVTSIGNSAFAYCRGLTSVNIPNSVTSIGNSAFFGCSGLTSVNIPNSVTSIGNSAFSGCSGLTSVNIPNSVTSIGNSAFFGCSGLTSVNIPNSVTSIGNSAFAYCRGLTSVNIPNSITSIGNSAFWGCSGLTSVNIPNSVTSIGNDAFFDCDSLTSIIIPKGRRGLFKNLDLYDDVMLIEG